MLRQVRAEDRAEIAETALLGALRQIKHMERWAADRARAAELFKEMVTDRADELRAAPTDAWPAILEKIELDAIDAADPAPITRAVHGTKGGAG